MHSVRFGFLVLDADPFKLIRLDDILRLYRNETHLGETTQFAGCFMRGENKQEVVHNVEPVNSSKATHFGLPCSLLTAWLCSSAASSLFCNALVQQYLNTNAE